LQFELDIEVEAVVEMVIEVEEVLEVILVQVLDE
jgi:hypothetical protein